MKQTFLPLVLSEQVVTFIDVIKEIGEDHYQLQNKTLLPENIEILKSSFITKEVVTNFFTTIDSTLPDHIKYQVIRQTALRNARYIVQIFNLKAAETLFDAISIFVNNAHGISTDTTFEFKSYMNKQWLVCRRRHINEPWFQFSETYVVCVLIEIIRQLIDKQWATSMIRIQSNTIYLEALPQPYQGLPVYSCQEGTGIHIARDQLYLKRSQWNQTDIPKPSKNDTTSQTSFDQSLKKALTPYLCEGRISLSKATTITKMTKRTLQRRLSEMNMTFSQLLDCTIEDEAKRLLQQKVYSITQISYMLGYITPAHFSRAFKRMTKMTPNAYRKQFINKYPY
ncbi:helix-turn-helix domain-containing protein [Photobacterium sp. SDRW27]|uniref:helix-turn-helix domain-containing protein n=1 Tax=Photobacterium obscurum TaxID=2829490 RepID=UPI002244D53D|nr:helix-turn-helix domain-containing protein [Photobacterium obscurum]MCW8331407.1 helix-turn-helix domain-containing protein [Photobacterium obscurum]